MLISLFGFTRRIPFILTFNPLKHNEDIMSFYKDSIFCVHPTLYHLCETSRADHVFTVREMIEIPNIEYKKIEKMNIAI